MASPMAEGGEDHALFTELSELGAEASRVFSGIFSRTAPAPNLSPSEPAHELRLVAQEQPQPEELAALAVDTLPPLPPSPQPNAEYTTILGVISDKIYYTARRTHINLQMASISGLFGASGPRTCNVGCMPTRLSPSSSALKHPPTSACSKHEYARTPLASTADCIRQLICSIAVNCNSPPLYDASIECYRISDDIYAKMSGIDAERPIATIYVPQDSQLFCDLLERCQKESSLSLDVAALQLVAERFRAIGRVMMADKPNGDYPDDDPLLRTVYHRAINFPNTLLNSSVNSWMSNTCTGYSLVPCIVASSGDASTDYDALQKAASISTSFATAVALGIAYGGTLKIESDDRRVAAPCLFGCKSTGVLSLAMCVATKTGRLRPVVAVTILQCGLVYRLVAADMERVVSQEWRVFACKMLSLWIARLCHIIIIPSTLTPFDLSRPRIPADVVDYLSEKVACRALLGRTLITNSNLRGTCTALGLRFCACAESANICRCDNVYYSTARSDERPLTLVYTSMNVSVDMADDELSSLAPILEQFECTEEVKGALHICITKWNALSDDVSVSFGLCQSQRPVVGLFTRRAALLMNNFNAAVTGRHTRVNASERAVFSLVATSFSAGMTSDHNVIIGSKLDDSHICSGKVMHDMASDQPVLDSVATAIHLRLVGRLLEAVARASPHLLHPLHVAVAREVYRHGTLTCLIALTTGCDRWFTENNFVLCAAQRNSSTVSSSLPAAVPSNQMPFPIWPALFAVAALAVTGSETTYTDTVDCSKLCEAAARLAANIFDFADAARMNTYDMLVANYLVRPVCYYLKRACQRTDALIDKQAGVINKIVHGKSDTFSIIVRKLCTKQKTNFRARLLQELNTGKK